MRNYYPQWLPLEEFQCRWCRQIANSFITLMVAMHVPVRTRRNKTYSEVHMEKVAKAEVKSQEGYEGMTCGGRGI